MEGRRERGGERDREGGERGGGRKERKGGEEDRKLEGGGGRRGGERRGGTFITQYSSTVHIGMSMGPCMGSALYIAMDTRKFSFHW